MDEARPVFTADALAGEVALVTGASRGIGRAIATALARAGATVIGTATSAAGAQSIGDALGQGRGAVLDVNDAPACEAIIDEVTRAHGKLSVLVNNAGITRDTLAMRMKDEDFGAVIDTNLGAVFRLSRGVLRGMMKARFGRIINITSVVGSMGNPGQANYAAAKAGIVGFSKSLAREVGSRNITVNCVAPGFIDTDMTKGLPDEQKTALLAHVPLGRFGHAQEVAAAVTFLASDGAAYITGNSLHVNGGMYMG